MVYAVVSVVMLSIIVAAQSSPGYNEDQPGRVSPWFVDESQSGADSGVDVVTMGTVTPSGVITVVNTEEENNNDTDQARNKSGLNQGQDPVPGENNQDISRPPSVSTPSSSDSSDYGQPEGNSTLSSVASEPVSDDIAPVNTTTTTTTTTTVKNPTTPREGVHSAVETYTVEPITTFTLNKSDESSNDTNQPKAKNIDSIRVWFETNVRLDVDQTVTKSINCCGATSLRSTNMAYMTFSRLSPDVHVPTNEIKKQKCSGCKRFGIDSIVCTVQPHHYETGITYFESSAWQCHSPRSDLSAKYNHSLSIICTVIKTNGDFNVCVHQDRCRLTVTPHPNAGEIIPAMLRSRRSPFHPMMARVVLLLTGILVSIALIVGFLVFRNCKQ